MIQIRRSELRKLAQNKLGDDSIESQNKILVMMSTSMCARTSYTVVGDEKEFTTKQQIDLHDKLTTSGHYSPFEHCARAMSDEEYKQFGKSHPDDNNVEGCDYVADYCHEDIHLSFQQGWCLNYKGFIQYRYLLQNSLI